jgi:hypothetical protein
MQNISSRNKGIIVSMMMIALSHISYFTLPDNRQFLTRYVIMAVFIAGLFWTIFDYKKTNEEVDIKTYFNEGFKNFIVVSFFMALYTFIFYKIFPLPFEYESFINNNKKQLLEQGNRTASEIEENANQWKNYFVPLILSIYNFTFLIMGALVSGILAYIYGKKK